MKKGVKVILALAGMAGASVAGLYTWRRHLNKKMEKEFVEDEDDEEEEPEEDTFEDDYVDPFEESLVDGDFDPYANDELEFVTISKERIEFIKVCVELLATCYQVTDMHLRHISRLAVQKEKMTDRICKIRAVTEEHARTVEDVERIKNDIFSVLKGDFPEDYIFFLEDCEAEKNKDMQEGEKKDE